MSEFKDYKRSQVANLRPVTQNDIEQYKASQSIEKIPAFMEWRVSISAEDLKNGSPKIGDMIARNPKNHLDEWLVAEQYFKDNFEPYARVVEFPGVYDNYASAALQALISKMDLLDTKGSLGKEVSQEELLGVKRELARSAHAYATLMLQTRDEFTEYLDSIGIYV